MDLVSPFNKVYQLLEDEESKYIYINRLNYLITEDYKYLQCIFNKSVPKLVENQHNRTLDFIASLPQNRPIILYGAGADGIEKLHYFENDARFIGFCDRDPEKQKAGIHGYPVISPDELILKKDITIVISTRRGLHTIEQFLLENGFEKNSIYKLANYMIDIEPGQYFNPDFIKFEEREIFIDAGCLDLGSAMLMKRYCPTLHKVYAFEPDPQNYQKCLKNCAQFKNEVVKIFPYATWSKKTKLFFDAESDGSSRITDNGQVCIETMPIDEIVDPTEKITFIKMDVEGAELESLKGAKETIKRCRPKLAICIYHKPEDLTEIPLYIKSLVPEYKLYVRHHSNSIAETVLYAII